MAKEEKTTSAIPEIKNKNIETYAEDMAKVIASDQGGLIKKIIHEQEKEDAEKNNFSPRSKKNQFFIFTSLILVFLAFGLLIVLGVFKKTTDIVDITPQYIPPIFIDQNYFQAIDNLNKDQIAQSILNEVNNTNVKKGGVEGIYLTENKQVIGFKKFIEVIKGNFDIGGFIFVDDNFLIGAVNEEKKSLFFLLRVRSFADIFPSLRIWEAKMFVDLHGFFGIDLTPETGYLLTKSFEDGFIFNKNARILKDQDGGIVLMYVFADDNFVIIANSEETTDEVVIRLRGSQIKK